MKLAALKSVPPFIKKKHVYKNLADLLHPVVKLYKKKQNKHALKILGQLFRLKIKILKKSKQNPI